MIQFNQLVNEITVDTKESIFHSEAGKTKKRREEGSHAARQSVKSLMVTYLKKPQLVKFKGDQLSHMEVD